MKNSLANKAAVAENRPAVNQPNIVYINADDLGYGDVACYGSAVNKTPFIDRMAEEGVLFTDFYACPYCTPSRASLMTGCYALRAGLPSVLGPNASIGLSDNEITIAENLKGAGYATAIIGKWHLGHHTEFLPTNHGFDYYFGLPYSNDMNGSSPTPLIRNEDVVEWEPDQATITQRYTEECIHYIKTNRNKPFFLYFAHMYVHKPLIVTDEALKKSDNGEYGATVETVDWSVGQILDTLKTLGLEENTMVIFTSDNGAFLNSKGASNAPLSGQKGQVAEGGMRVPFIVRWPGQVPEGKVNSEIATVMDMFPTFSALAGATVPADRVIDGKNILPLIKCEEGAATPHEAILYYVDRDLRAVRSGKWKLNVHTKSLYDLKNDIEEKTNLYSQYPEIVERLTEYVNAAILDIGNKDTTGKNARPSGDCGKSTSVYANVNGLTVEEIRNGNIIVTNLIDALPALELLDRNNAEHVAAVKQARKAFDALSEEEQEMAMAVNYDDLLAAEVAFIS